MDDDFIAAGLVAIVVAALLFLIFWPPLPSLESEIQRLNQQRSSTEIQPLPGIRFDVFQDTGLFV
jgi:type II secretory pathway component PulM